MRIIDGRKIATRIEGQLKLKVAKLKLQGIVPRLGITFFEDDLAGAAYTRLKVKAAARIGIEVETAINEEAVPVWAEDNSIHGIIVQWPGYLSKEFSLFWQKLVNKIPPEKDVDGLRPDSKFVPATVKAVEKIIYKFIIDRDRNYILIVGQGMVGKALAKRLNAKNISSHDKNLSTAVGRADILITACGRPGLIKAVKAGAAVIDCGWPKGDVNFDAVKNTAGAITPVPGGVGPVTVVCLLENLVEAVYNRL